MNEAWLAAAPSVLIGLALLLVPGAVVVIAGWGPRSLTAWLFTPGLSVAIIAVSASLAPIIGLSWSLLPVALVTAAAACVAWGVSRWVGRGEQGRRGTWYVGGARAFATAGISAAAAAITIAIQLMIVFGEPENISQTFDNIVHLNAIRFTLDAGDASAFAVGRTSDIGFYPNGWHSIVTLVAQLGGMSIPAAVNAANIAIFSFAWPVSSLALAATVFAARPAALAATAVLTTGFSAFPLLLLDFGVLYPNATAYAVLPAGLAAVWLVLSSPGRDRVRAILLLLVVCTGIGFSHPNAFLALFALSSGTVIAQTLLRAWQEGTRRSWLTAAAIVAGLGVALLGLWRFGRTNASMSAWDSWQSTAQAFGEAALVSPREYPITPVTAILLLIGMIAIVRRPVRLLRIGLPFATAALLFIVVSGLPVGTAVRDLMTNPWYNDSYRLAALLPIAGVPVATVGVLVVVDALSALARRHSWPEWFRLAGVIGVTAATFVLAATGPNISAGIERAQSAYRMDATSALLTSNERALLDRLDQSVPGQAILIVNPWTGGSLAYALAGREILERHVFSARTLDEELVDGRLRDIDTDPAVCSAVTRLDAEFVLDFGSQNVFSRVDSGGERAGLNDLSESEHLVLVDSEGDDARLFQIVGC